MLAEERERPGNASFSGEGKEENCGPYSDAGRRRGVVGVNKGLGGVDGVLIAVDGDGSVIRETASRTWESTVLLSWVFAVWEVLSRDMCAGTG